MLFWPLIHAWLWCVGQNVKHHWEGWSESPYQQQKRAYRNFPSNSPDFSLLKNPVKLGGNPIALVIWHYHRQWSKRFIWLWMCLWPRPAWILVMQLFSGISILQTTVVSLCSCVWGKRIASVELGAASSLWLRQKGRAGGLPAVLAYKFKL